MNPAQRELASIRDLLQEDIERAATVAETVLANMWQDLLEHQGKPVEEFSVTVTESLAYELGKHGTSTAAQRVLRDQMLSEYDSDMAYDILVTRVMDNVSSELAHYSANMSKSIEGLLEKFEVLPTFRLHDLGIGNVGHQLVNLPEYTQQAGAIALHGMRHVGVLDDMLYTMHASYTTFALQQSIRNPERDVLKMMQPGRLLASDLNAVLSMSVLLALDEVVVKYYDEKVPGAWQAPLYYGEIVKEFSTVFSPIADKVLSFHLDALQHKNTYR